MTNSRSNTCRQEATSAEETPDRPHLALTSPHLVHLLREIATDAPLATVLADLAAIVERDATELQCCVLLADAGSDTLRPGAAPSLPSEYVSALDHVPIDEGRGCCGTAAARGELVVVADIEVSLLWLEYRELARRHGLRACWSLPFFDSSGAVIGTLAVYAATPRAPTPDEVELLRCAALLAGLVVTRHRDAQQLHSSVDNYRRLAELSPDAVCVHRGGVLLYANPAAWDLLGLAATPTETSFSLDAVLPAEAATALKQLHGGTSWIKWRRPNGTTVEIEVRSASTTVDGYAARLLVCRDVSDRVAMEREVLLATERERARLASDLHDGIGQHLTGISLHLAGAITAVDVNPVRAQADLRRIASMVSESIGEVRRLARASFPVHVERAGLALELRALANRANDAGSIDVTFGATAGADDGLDGAVATQLFRLGQEALNNALRHASPATVQLALARDDKELVFTVIDDGIGIPPPTELVAGVGIRSIRYRAALIGASVTIARREPAGTQVEVRVPLAEAIGGMSADRA